MNKVLLCPPLFFDIEYEINPWMDLNKKVDQQKVQTEYQILKQTYLELGLDILEIEQGKNLPDMVYAANYGFVKNKIFIKSNFKFDERKGEETLAKQYFHKLGFTIKELPEHINWEGQGDFLTVGRKYFLGWGKRSDPESKKYLSDILQADIIDFELINPYYYHLDTCFLPLTTDTVAINAESFTKKGLEEINKHFSHIITVSKKDNDLLACNAVVTNKTIVLGKGISDALKNDFEKAGFGTKEVPMDEYRKGGGSVKCLTLEFF